MCDTAEEVFALKLSTEAAASAEKCDAISQTCEC